MLKVKRRKIVRRPRRKQGKGLKKTLRKVGRVVKKGAKFIKKNKLISKSGDALAKLGIPEGRQIADAGRVFGLGRGGRMNGKPQPFNIIV